MTAPLMPKATALWLVENTTLTFQQIADFCQLHVLEVQAIADGEASVSTFGFDPIAHNQASQADIDRCSQDPDLRLVLIHHESLQPKKKSAKYTTMAVRQDKPDAIAWLLKHYPALSMARLCRLVGTTKTTVQAVASKSHWNASQIKPRNPVTLGICSQKELDDAIIKTYKGDAPMLDTSGEDI